MVILEKQRNISIFSTGVDALPLGTEMTFVRLAKEGVKRLFGTLFFLWEEDPGNRAPSASPVLHPPIQNRVPENPLF
jgi:hypothetical protein